MLLGFAGIGICRLSPLVKAARVVRPTASKAGAGWIFAQTDARRFRAPSVTSDPVRPGMIAPAADGSRRREGCARRSQSPASPLPGPGEPRRRPAQGPGPPTTGWSGESCRRASRYGSGVEPPRLFTRPTTPSAATSRAGEAEESGVSHERGRRLRVGDAGYRQADAQLKQRDRTPPEQAEDSVGSSRVTNERGEQSLKASGRTRHRDPVCRDFAFGRLLRPRLAWRRGAGGIGPTVSRGLAEPGGRVRRCAAARPRRLSPCREGRCRSRREGGWALCSRRRRRCRSRREAAAAATKRQKVARSLWAVKSSVRPLAMNSRSAALPPSWRFEPVRCPLDPGWPPERDADDVDAGVRGGGEKHPPQPAVDRPVADFLP